LQAAGWHVPREAVTGRCVAAADLLNNRARLIKYFDLSGGRLIFLIDVANRSMIGDYSWPVSDHRLDAQAPGVRKGAVSDPKLPQLLGSEPSAVAASAA
jgi:hypothetical protein